MTLIGKVVSLKCGDEIDAARVEQHWTQTDLQPEGVLASGFLNELLDLCVANGRRVRSNQRKSLSRTHPLVIIKSPDG